MSIPSAQLTNIAAVAAREAGAVAREGFRSPGLEVTEKSDFHDLVTVYDRLCEERVRDVIERAVPGSRVLGEECGLTGDGDITWLVDPIDGTSNFARGIALWAVCIAAAVDGEIVAGVVYDPVADHLFQADEDGARLNGKLIRAEGATTPESATVISSFPYARDLTVFRAEALESFGRLQETFAHVRDFGSTAISLCHVAAGWADAAFCFEVNPWDVSAAAFILKQAGGIYRTYGEGKELPAARDYLNRHYSASVVGADFPLIDQIMREQSRRPGPATVPFPQYSNPNTNVARNERGGIATFIERTAP